jgi:divalent metal cation (Fe/Co/Zn/Cd) transporter
MSFAALAAYVGFEAVRQLGSGDAPESSAVGIALAAVSLVVMPVLARAKRRLAPALGSRAQAAEANQTPLCALMSAVVLVGLAANALLGWWWADPVAALGMSYLLVREGLQAWAGDDCCD